MEGEKSRILVIEDETDIRTLILFNLRKEIVDGLMAVGGDPHSLPAPQKLHNNASARIGFAGSRGPLNKEIAVIQIRRHGLEISLKRF